VLEGSPSRDVDSDEMEESDDSNDTSNDDQDDRNRYREKEEATPENMITVQGLVEILERILSFHAFYKCRHPFEWDSL
jgi:hypothetical protein